MKEGARMKIIGILIGTLGTLLFAWHSIRVINGTDVGFGMWNHQTLSLVGGILILIGTGIYILGRRRGR